MKYIYLKRNFVGFVLSLSIIIIGFFGTTYAWFQTTFDNQSNTIQSSGFDVQLAKSSTIDNDELTGNILNSSTSQEEFKKFFSLTNDLQLVSQNQGNTYVKIHNEGNVDLDFKIDGFLISGANSIHLEHFVVSLVPISFVGETKVRSLDELIDTSLFNTGNEGSSFQKNSSLVYQIYFNYTGSASVVGLANTFEFGLHFSFWYNDNLFSEPFIVKDYQTLTDAVSQTTQKNIHILNNINVQNNLTVNQLLNFNLYGNSLTLNEFTLESNQYGAVFFENGTLEVNQYEIFLPNGIFRHYYNFEINTVNSHVLTSEDGYLLDGDLVTTQDFVLGGETLLSVLDRGNLVIYGNYTHQHTSTITKNNGLLSDNTVFISNHDDYSLSLHIGSVSQFNTFTTKFNQGLEDFQSSLFEVKLKRDLDFKGNIIHQIGSATITGSPIPWKGIFNGNGKKIANYFLSFNSLDVGIFFQNDGQIKNLELGINNLNFTHQASSSTASKELNVGFLVSRNRGNLLNIRTLPTTMVLNFRGYREQDQINLGGLVGKDICTISTCNSNNLNYQNIENNFSFTVNSNSLTFLKIGGILGTGVSNFVKNISHVTNNGNIAYRGRGFVSAGGISGYLQNAIVNFSKNNGEIDTYSDDEATNAGGFFGRLSTSEKVQGVDEGQNTTIMNSINSAIIKSSSYGLTNRSGYGGSGGFIGFFTGYKLMFSNVINNANILSLFYGTTSASNQNHSGGLVGFSMQNILEINQSISVGNVEVGNRPSSQNGTAGGFVGFPHGSSPASIKISNNLFYGTVKTDTGNPSYQMNHGFFLPFNLAHYGNRLILYKINYYLPSSYLVHNGNQVTVSNAVGTAASSDSAFNSAFLVSLGWTETYWDLSDVNLYSNKLPLPKF